MYGVISRNMILENKILNRKITFNTVVDKDFYKHLTVFFGELETSSTQLIKETYQVSYVGELLERFSVRGITSDEHLLTLIVALDINITSVSDIKFTFNTNQLSEFTNRVRNATNNSFIHVLSYIVDLKCKFTKPFDYEAFELLLNNLTPSEIVFAKAFLLDHDEACLNDDMKVKVFKRLVTELNLETLETSNLPIEVQHLILESASLEYDLFRFKKGFWKGQPYHYEFYITAWRLQKKSMDKMNLHLKPFVVWSYHMKSIIDNEYECFPYARRHLIRTALVFKSMLEYTKDEVLDMYSLEIVGEILDFCRLTESEALNQLLLESLTDSQKRTIYYVLTITSKILASDSYRFNSKVIGIIEPSFLSSIEPEFIQISYQYQLDSYDFKGIKDYSEAYSVFSKSVGMFLKHIQLKHFEDVSLDSLEREELEKIELSRTNYNEAFTTLVFDDTRYRRDAVNCKASFMTGDKYLQVLIDKGIYDNTWETMSTLRLGALKPIIERYISKNFDLYYMNLKEQIDKEEIRLFIIQQTSMDMIFDGNVSKDGVRTWIEMYMSALNEFKFHKIPSVLIELYGKVAETDYLSTDELSNLYVACRIAITHSEDTKNIQEIKKQYFIPIANVIEEMVSEGTKPRILTESIITQLEKRNLIRLCSQDVDELVVVFKRYADNCLTEPNSKDNFEQKTKVVMEMINYLKQYKNLMVISDSLNNRVGLYMEKYIMSIYNQSDFEFIERLLQIKNNQLEGVN
ncbi:hypothetical protein ABD87_14810 [Lysinibacillus sphaericus]|uniref:hypothetical protein n=1 Tax=Lysinibacillus sphaericus TaxID=1421 RepID=UPI0018CE11CB|nr:hypothetical protein [Lysinibacillus sphaericus]MBG9730767.1 hypothetical protein [Lysinibacillus sphaericus]